MTLVEVTVAASLAIVLLSLFARVIVDTIDRSRRIRERAHSAAVLDRSIRQLRRDRSLESEIDDSGELRTPCWHPGETELSLGPFRSASGPWVLHRFVRRSGGEWLWERIVDDGPIHRIHRLATELELTIELPDPTCRARVMTVEPSGYPWEEGEPRWIRLAENEHARWLGASGNSEAARVIRRFENVALIAAPTALGHQLIAESDAESAILTITRHGVERTVRLFPDR